MNIVFTCQTDSSELCLEELMRADNKARFNRWLCEGVGVVHSSEEFSSFSRALIGIGAIFTRHIFPGEYEIDLQGELPANLVAELVVRMEREHSFAVQARGFDKGAALSAGDIAEFITGELKGMGLICDMRTPEVIISCVLSGGKLYAGLSKASENLSAKAGGMIHYAKYDGQISRAEFKLLEAIEAFSLRFKPDCAALDLGAAPGGWTAVLLRAGMSVVAVDPGSMAELLLANKKLEHFRGTAQDFLMKDKRGFGLIVNDMRMDVWQSAEIMLELYDRLEEEGIAVMTFKLPAKKRKAVIDKGRAILETRYRVLHVKQLFHNRSEVTVVLGK